MAFRIAPSAPGTRTVEHFADELVAAVRRCKNPVLVGLDPRLQSLPEASLNINHAFEIDGERITALVSLENTGPGIAFFLDMNISGEKSGQTVLPVFWDDNYISLLPGESRKVQAWCNRKDLRNDQPVFSINGWNLKNYKYK